MATEMIKTKPQILSPEKLQGWEKLEPKEQTKVTVEIEALTKAANTYELSFLEIGEHLENIRKVLEPRRMFNAWLMSWCQSRKRPIKRSWAYQLMSDFRGAKAALPAPILKAAMARGTKLDSRAIAALPAPNTKDPQKIKEYLDKLETTKIEVTKAPDRLLKECINFVGLRWEQLPPNNKTRTAWMHKFIGMALAKFGVASEQSFSPQAIPESFIAKRGRPRLVKRAA